MSGGIEFTDGGIPKRIHGQHHKTADNRYKRFASNEVEAPVAKIIARQSLSQSEIKKSRKKSDDGNPADLLNSLFKGLKDKMRHTNYSSSEGDGGGAAPAQPFTATTGENPEQEAPNVDYSMVAYDHFLINQIQLQKRDQTQIIDTFEDSYLYTFGEAPEQATFSGFLINSMNHNWRSGWINAYDQLLSANNSLQEFVDTVIVYENQILKGRILNTNLSQNARNPMAVQFSFNFYIEEDRSPKENNPYHTPLKNLKDAELPESARFQQTNRQDNDQGGSGGGPPKNREDRTGGNRGDCKGKIADNMSTDTDCSDINEVIKSALGSNPCQNLSDKPRMVRQALREWVQNPLKTAQREINKMISGETTTNQDEQRELLVDDFRPLFTKKTAILKVLTEIDEFDQSDKEDMKKAADNLRPDRYEILFSGAQGTADTNKMAEGGWKGPEKEEGARAVGENESVENDIFDKIIISDYWVSNGWLSNKPQNFDLEKFPKFFEKLDEVYVEHPHLDESMHTAAQKITELYKKLKNGEIKYSIWKNSAADADAPGPGSIGDLAENLTEYRLEALKDAIKNKRWMEDQGWFAGSGPPDPFQSLDTLIPSPPVMPDADDIDGNSIESRVLGFVLGAEKFVQEGLQDADTIQKKWVEELKKQARARISSINPNKDDSILQEINSKNKEVFTDKLGAAPITPLQFLFNYGFQSRNPSLDYHNFFDDFADSDLFDPEDRMVAPSPIDLEEADGVSRSSMLTNDGLVKAGSGPTHPANLATGDKLAKVAKSIGNQAFVNGAEMKPVSGFPILYPGISKQSPNTVDPWVAGKVKVKYGQASESISTDDEAVFDEDKNKGNAKTGTYDALMVLNTKTMDDMYKNVVQKLEKSRERYQKLYECQDQIKTKYLPRDGSDAGLSDNLIRNVLMGSLAYDGSQQEEG